VALASNVDGTSVDVQPPKTASPSEEIDQEAAVQVTAVGEYREKKPMQYGFIGWIVVGLIAGVLAKWVMPGKDPGGIIVTILIGVAGGLIGGFLASKLGIGGGNIVNILIATVGAVLLLWIYRMVKRRSA